MFNNHAGKPVFLNKETLLRAGAARSPALVQIISRSSQKDSVLRKLGNGQFVSNMCFPEKENMLQQDFPKCFHNRLQCKPR